MIIFRTGSLCGAYRGISGCLAGEYDSYSEKEASTSSRRLSVCVPSVWCEELSLDDNMINTITPLPRPLPIGLIRMSSGFVRDTGFDFYV